MVRLLQAPSESNRFKAFIFFIALFLLFTSVHSPATAVPNGTIACTDGGTFTVNSNIVTMSTACTGRANIPNGITEIANDAFKSRTGLTSAFIPKTVTQIGSSAFQQSNLASIDFEPGSTLTTIASAAFQSTRLTSIVIPDSVTEIGNYQFWVSNSLTSVVLPKNLSVLREYVFGNMTAFSTITLPVNLPLIEANAFQAVSALTSYTYCGTRLSSANLNSGGLSSKTRICVAPQIAFSSSAEVVNPNNPITGYAISTSNNFGGGVANYSISPNISTTPGLAFNTETGLMSGTPTTVAAAQIYTITATNFAGTATPTFTLTVAAVLAAPAFTLSSSSESRTVNTAATGFTANSTGGAIASFSISATPPGTSFDTTTGTLTGTPSTVAPTTTYTVTATNASGNATQTFSLTVTAAPVNNSAAQAEAAKKQKELLELLSIIPSLGSIALNLGETTKALTLQKCVKKKDVRYVKKGAKCPKGFVRKR